MLIPNEPWQAKAAAKRASTLAKIVPEWRLSQTELDRAYQQRDLTGPYIQQYLNNDEQEIIRQNATTIVAKIKSGAYTAKRVTLAFCKCAAIAHQINNCLHEIFFDQAIERAETLDEHHRKYGSTVGPLHGLPISLKDQFHVKGNDTSMGFVGWLGTFEGNPDKSLVHKVNSQIVDELISLGAVLYCKTSVPQTLLFGETKNNIIGTTLNPNNQNLSCGGSSGGEGALQALRGSLVGLGTDIGGSVRIPAAFNGTYAIKPSPSRLSYRNVANIIPGQTTYPSTVGIMGTSLDAVHLVFESLIFTEPWRRDPGVVPLPWNKPIFRATLERVNVDGSAKPNMQLKLGVCWTDNLVTPHPPITRGLEMVVNAVKNAGHKITQWAPPDQMIAKRVHVSFLKADGGFDVHRQLNLSGEPLISDLRDDFQLTEPMSLLKYQQLTTEGRDFEAAYSDYWNSTGYGDGQMVDAIIMPVAPHAAVVPGKYYDTAYTETINLLSYSAVVIPVTRADKIVDKSDHDYIPRNSIDALNWKAYDSGIYHGAPVGIQIVSRKFEEEKVLAIAKIIERALAAASA